MTKQHNWGLTGYSVKTWASRNKDYLKAFIIILVTLATAALNDWASVTVALKAAGLSAVALLGKWLTDLLDYATPDVEQKDSGFTKL